MQSAKEIAFGKFRLDFINECLWKDATAISLRPKAFAVLKLLVDHPGLLVTKQQILDTVWPGTFVGDAVLKDIIRQIREVLNDCAASPSYVETAHRRGYRFIAKLSPVAEDATAAEVSHLPEDIFEEPEASPPPVSDLAGASGPVPEQILNVESRATAAVVERQTLTPRWSRHWRAAGGILALGVMVVLLVSSRSTKVINKDTVVLSDFTNSTGDPVFDDTLRQGLSSQLEQSPFLNLLSEKRIAETISLMERPKGTAFTAEVAREVCQRTASAAVLEGSIAQVGTQYLLNLQATDCSSGERLGSAQAQASNKDRVLDVLGELATKIRGQLGESLASVQKYDAPPENVTTPSFDALKAYTLGYQAMVVKSDYAGAIPLFQRAIAFDPKFAMAYARAGMCYSNLDDTVRSAENVRKAYELRRNVSEREKLYIESHYQILVTGDLEAARKIYELSAQVYPTDTLFSNLGLIYSELGDFDKALGAYQESLRMNPGTGNRYANLMSGYLQLNRVQDAKRAAQEAEDRGIDAADIQRNLFLADFLQGDRAGMVRRAAALMNNPGHEDQMLDDESDAASYFGELAKARVLTRQAVESARKNDGKEAAALYLAESSLREALVENKEMAKQQAQAALALSNSRDVTAFSAIALGLSGDFKRALRLADELAQAFPADTIARSHYLPAIHAAAMVGSQNRGNAIANLMEPVANELGGNLETARFVLYPTYLRGQAYLASKNGSAAAAEFQKILDHSGAVGTEPIGALAHLQLARAFVISGDQANAKRAYQNFFTLWDKADPDIPVLRQAKLEYSKLPSLKLEALKLGTASDRDGAVQ